MGLKMAPSYANLFMGKFKQKALATGACSKLPAYFLALGTRNFPLQTSFLLINAPLQSFLFQKHLPANIFFLQCYLL